MNRHEDELKIKEVFLINKTFTQEDTSLYTINYDFPTVNGASFMQILSERFKSADFKMLELGGGISQHVALEILNKFPGIKYIGLEKRSLKPEIIDLLSVFSNYRYVQAGISELSDQFTKREFDIIFAHNVGKHLPNPFYMLELAYPLLKPDGIFYTNHLSLYRGEWEKIAQYFSDYFPGMLFAGTSQSESPLMKAGVVPVSLAVRKLNNDFNLPITVGEKYIVDTQGNINETHEIFFADQEAV